MATRSKSAAARFPRRVAIIGGNRIPFARSNGAYAEASNQDMLIAALTGLVSRYELAGERLGDGSHLHSLLKELVSSAGIRSSVAF